MNVPFSVSSMNDCNQNNQKNLYYFNHLNTLKQLATSFFTWKNLPEGITSRFLENLLYYQGMFAFAKSPTIGIIARSCSGSGMLNAYDDSISYQLISNRDQKDYKLSDIVLVRNNIDSIPTIMTTSLFASKLTSVDKTIDMNLYLMRKPYMVTCKESQLLSVKNMFKKVDEFAPLIIADKDMETYQISVLEVNVPYNIDKLQVQKDCITNECLTRLGINNTNINKKERLITDEANSNNEMIKLMAKSFRDYRDIACAQANDMWGTNMYIETNEDILESTVESMQEVNQ